MYTLNFKCIYVLQKNQKIMNTIFHNENFINEDQLKIKPVYKTFPGWKTSTNGIKNMESLPENAKKYIYAVEDFIGAKVSSVSTSPERDDTILVENPFDI